jgi:MinD superfamily P-loop ATPase
VIINRDGVGDTQVETFCLQAGIPILMRIPLQREIGAGIAQGKTLVEIQPSYEAQFQVMAAQIEEICAKENGR